MNLPLTFGLRLARGGRSFWRLPAGLIAAAVAVLIMIIAVARGFDRELLDKVLTAGAHVTVTDREGLGFADWREALQHFRARPGVAAAGARFTGDTLIESSGLGLGARAVGIEAAYEIELSPHLTGRLHERQNRGWCIVGSILAERLKLGPGDALRLQAGGRELNLMCSDTFSVGLHDYDLSFVYLSLADAWELFDYPEIATSIVLRLDDASRAREIAQRISREFPDVLARSWEELNRPLVATIAIEQQIMRLVVLLAAALSLFGFALLIRLTVEARRRLIGLLETFGMSRREIRSAFLVEGVIVVLTGTLAGIPLGWLGCRLLATLRLPLPPEMATTYGAEWIPVWLQLEDVCFVTGVEVVLALLVTVWMTARVMNQGTAELLRT